MPIRQTRIFVRSDEANDWSETLIGRVFLPLTKEFADVLEWFWFSRYVVTDAVDCADCDIASIPDEYKRPLQEGASPITAACAFGSKWLTGTGKLPLSAGQRS
jgi:hypothetical protein